MARKEILERAIREYPVGTKIRSCQSGSIYTITSQKARWSDNDLQFESGSSGPYIYPYIHHKGSWSEILEKAPSVEPEVINSYSIF